MDQAERSCRDSPSKCEDMSDSVSDFGPHRFDDDYFDHDNSSPPLRHSPRPFDVLEMEEPTEEHASHPGLEFSFFIEDLPIRRNIIRDVDLEELVNLEYVTEGSSSHIFSAIWEDEQVIVKVIMPIMSD